MGIVEYVWMFWSFGIFGIFGYLILGFFAFGVFVFVPRFLCSWNYQNHTQHGPNIAPKWPKRDPNMTPKPYPKLSEDDPKLPLKRSLLNKDPYVCVYIYENLCNTYSKHRQNTQNTHNTLTTHTQNIHNT